MLVMPAQTILGDRPMKPNARNLAELTPRSNAAEDVLAAITLGDDDITVANAAAGWLLTRHLGPPFKFSVTLGEYKDEPPFNLPCDWKRKNVVGIKTNDRARAHTWITAALLAGHCPMVWEGNFAHGCGSIAGIRQNIDQGAHVFSPHSTASKRRAA
jgi:hypothetical protein